MTDTAAEKVVLRRRLRGIEIPAGASEALCARLREVAEVESAACVLAYLSLPDEVSVDGWIAEALDRGVRVCVPRVEWDSGSMEPVLLGRMGHWTVGRHGLRGPAAGAAVVPIEEVGAVLVPGLGFDMRGRRLGRGGGFYDRLLARLPVSVWRIGVAAEARVVERLPADEWDENLDMLVTESGTRRFERTKD